MDHGIRATSCVATEALRTGSARLLSLVKLLQFRPRILIAVLSRFLVPFDCSIKVLRYSGSVLVHDPDEVLGRRVVLHCGLFIPVERCGLTLRHATAVLI